MRFRPRGLALVSMLLAVAGGARDARAQAYEVVELLDGSTYQGQLVEKVPGDRVVIQLPTGEVKTFAWDKVARSSAAPLVSPPLAPRPQRASEAPSVVSTTPASGSQIISGWPDPHAQAHSAMPPESTGQRLYLGVVTSLPQFGSPRGLAGAMAEYRPLRWLGLEVDGAYDGPVEVSEGNLGASLAETIRIGSSFGLGLGASQHFDATGAGVAQMGHAELSFDLDLKGMSSAPITLRLAPGVATMFNGAQHPGACGFFNLLGGSTDENGNPTDTKCLFVYFDVEVFYRLRLTGDGAPR